MLKALLTISTDSIIVWTNFLVTITWLIWIELTFTRFTFLISFCGSKQRKDGMDILENLFLKLLEKGIGSEEASFFAIDTQNVSYFPFSSGVVKFLLQFINVQISLL